MEVIKLKEAQEQVPASEIDKTMVIVDQYNGAVFNNHIRLSKTDPIKYNFDPKVTQYGGTSVRQLVVQTKCI